jgi:hypothetical protein
VFCFLKTDLIRAFYAGALPSFAECKQLFRFNCDNNQFSGAYSRVSMDRSVVPDIPAVVFFFLKTDLIRACYAGVLPSFAECKLLTNFWCSNNQFSGACIDWRAFSTDRIVR